jgi:hypothetical protein
MRVLFDQGTPRPLQDFLSGHEVKTAYQLGWNEYKNGKLLSAAESMGFELLITTDKNLQYQQNLTGRKIAILVLPTTKWAQIRIHTKEIAEAVSACAPGSYRDLSW